MNNGNKIILLSFASDDLKKAFIVLKTGKRNKFYDEIRVMSFTDLDTDFKSIKKLV